MNNLVFDVPAEVGGALSVLEDFYNQAASCEDNNIKWFFIVSKPHLRETENIKVLRFPWIKKSWFHRLYFDHFVANKLVEKYNANKIISLQNTIVPHTKVSQEVFVHNALPFTEYKFSLRENTRLWIYQALIGKWIIESIRKADTVLVQTDWMRIICAEKSDVPISKIKVARPQVDIKSSGCFIANEHTLNTFFYPANGEIYKNHKLIVEACKILKNNNYNDYRIIFTLEGNENKHILELYNEIRLHRLPIEFIGTVKKESIFRLYTESILLFPSFIESFGLPILEAKLHRSVIFASDLPFSREILDGYENAHFFNPYKPKELASLMLDMRKQLYWVEDA